MTLLQSLFCALKLSLNLLKSFLAPLEPPQKPSLQSLPNELLLEIFSFLELKPYIICHGVCKSWRHLLPLTQMDPTRRRLLDLYHRVLNTPDFEKALEWTNQNLQEFDREEYIRCLLEQYPAIPEEFRMWILEWPARLVIQCIWPGLPFTCCRSFIQVSRQHGVNWIAYRSFSPLLLAPIYKKATPSQTVIPALFIWRSGLEAHWLLFEKDEPGLFGRVIMTHDYWHSFGSIPYYPSENHPNDEDSDTEDSDTESECSEGEENLFIWQDWIIYLHFHWSRTVDELQNPSKIFIRPDPPLDQPVQCIFNRSGDDILPAPAWASSQRSIRRSFLQLDS